MATPGTVARHARVIVIAGPSGSGKSRLSRRLGLPVLNLDMGVVDRDDPASWLHDDALKAIERLCRDGEADVPVYGIAYDGHVGHHRLELDGSPYFIAEGILAQEVVAECAARDLLVLVRRGPAPAQVRAQRRRTRGRPGMHRPHARGRLPADHPAHRVAADRSAYPGLMTSSMI